MDHMHKIMVAPAAYLKGRGLRHENVHVECTRFIFLNAHHRGRFCGRWRGERRKSTMAIRSAGPADVIADVISASSSSSSSSIRPSSFPRDLDLCLSDELLRKLHADLALFPTTSSAQQHGKTWMNTRSSSLAMHKAPQGNVDLRFLSPLPDTSVHAETTDTGLVHRAVSLGYIFCRWYYVSIFFFQISVMSSERRVICCVMAVQGHPRSLI